MSDTPRTNNFDWSFHLLFAEAQKMERELNAANDRIKLLKSTGDELLEWLKDGTISDSNHRLLANAWQRAKENKP